MSYYRVLGVAKDASKIAIRSAYLKKVKLHHPDVNKSAHSAKLFREIQEAYSVLSDANKRAEYDMRHEFERETSSSRTWSHEKSRSSTSSYDPFEEFWREQQDLHRRSGARRSHYEDSSSRFNANTRNHASTYSMFVIFLRALPLMLFPSFIFYLALRQLRMTQEARMQKPVVRYDSFGRAFVVDPYGRKHRVFEFDNIDSKER